MLTAVTVTGRDVQGAVTAGAVVVITFVKVFLITLVTVTGGSAATDCEF